MPEADPGEGKRGRALLVALAVAFAAAFALLASGVLRPKPPRNGGNGGTGSITWPEKAERLLLEAEAAAEITAPMATASDGEASGRQCLRMPCASCTGAVHLHLPEEERKRASARIRFVVKEAGTYVLWMRTKWCCECGDTFSMVLHEAGAPDDPAVAVDFGGDGTNKGRWKWRALRTPEGKAMRLDLKAGSHEILLRPREDGWRLDQVLLTTNADPDYAPQGIEKPEAGP